MKRKEHEIYYNHEQHMKYNTNMKFQQKMLLDDQELFNNSEFLHCLRRKIKEKKRKNLSLSCSLDKKMVAKHRYLTSQK